MGFKQHISRTWQMIEQQVNDVPFRPDDEAGGVKNQNLRRLVTIHKPALTLNGG